VGVISGMREKPRDGVARHEDFGHDRGGGISGKFPWKGRPTLDAISAIIDGSGLLSSHDCLACDVCCRFPSADSGLAPFFSNDERDKATAAGIEEAAFPPGRYGAGGHVLLCGHGSSYRCPGFDAGGNSCRLYAARPLDCRLYPFMLMYSPGGASVWLGADDYCPVVRERREGTAFAACAAGIARELEGAFLEEVLARPGMVADWREHVHPVRELPGVSKALCRSDLGLARLTMSARPLVEKYFAAHAGGLLGQTFGTVAVWSDVFSLYWKVHDDRLLVFAEGEGDCFLMAPPLGDGRLCEAGSEALRVMQRLNPRGVSPRVQEADEEVRAGLGECGWAVRESDVEYVYRREELAALRGNRYEKKRQMCNRFEREHSPAWRPYERKDFTGVVELYRGWLARRCAAHPGDFFRAQAEASFRCVLRALRDWEALGLTMRLLEAEGRLVGFTAGLPLHEGRTFGVLFEVADPTVRGAAQYLFREFCREMKGFELVSAGGASGLAGLARVKESYRPFLRPEKHVLIPTGSRLDGS